MSDEARSTLALVPELRAELTARRGPATAAVVRRSIAAVASRAGLRVDRIDDALLIADVVLADRELERADPLQVELAASGGALELRFGPLPTGEAQRLLASAAMPGIGPVIERLATTTDAQADAQGEYLSVVVGER